MAAPDYVAPIVGWRGWFVVEAGGALRPCSIVYHAMAAAAGASRACESVAELARRLGREHVQA
jgi:hypothetical protein